MHFYNQTDSIIIGLLALYFWESQELVQDEYFPYTINILVPGQLSQYGRWDYFGTLFGTSIC